MSTEKTIEKPDLPIPPGVITEGSDAVIQFIEALGLKMTGGAGVGDLTVACNMPVAGVVSFEVTAHLWATEAQILALKKVIQEGSAEGVPGVEGSGIMRILNADNPTEKLEVKIKNWPSKKDNEDANRNED